VASLTGNGAYLIQAAYNLRHNTTYQFYVAGAVSSGTSQLIASLFNGSHTDVSTTFNSSTTTIKYVTFTTGASDTSAVIYLKNTGSGTAFFTGVGFLYLGAAYNWGFEYGTASPWLYNGTAPTVMSSNQFDGFYGLKIANSSNIYETIAGLSPSTSYTFSAMGKTDAGTGTVAVYTSGGTLINSASFSSTSYSQTSVTFTTGSTASSVIILLQSSAGSSLFSYFDDAQLVLN
jgi:hypothetical protein